MNRETSNLTQPNSEPGWRAGELQQQPQRRPPAGVVLSPDPDAVAAIAAPMIGSRYGAHYAASLAECASLLRQEDMAFAIIDARLSATHVGGDLAALQSLHPEMPVFICLSLQAPAETASDLLRIGAFDVWRAPPYPAEAVHAFERMVAWKARNACAQSTSHSRAAAMQEPDRPLLAEVSHEMRSPLTSIIGFAETIETQSIGDWSSSANQYCTYARHIRSSGEHLLALFDDLLSLGDAEVLPVDLDQKVDPGSIASFVKEMFDSSAVQKGVSLTASQVQPLTPIALNRRLIVQALINLVQNAIKFTPSGHDIRISVRQNGTTVFEVADSGIGFDPNHLALPRQVNAGGTQASHGHGLGLNFVRRVAKIHGGSFVLESAPGKGTIARLSIPHG